MKHTAGLTGPAWTASTREEVLAVLHLIAGLLAWQADIRWLAWLLFVKAGIDTVCAIIAAFAEIYQSKKGQHETPA